MNTTEETKIENKIGRCPVKGCKCIMSVLVPMKKVIRTRGPFRIQYVAFESGNLPFGSWIYCIAHRREIIFRTVKGTLNEAHTCDARCLCAVGGSCECSCGGANHGAAYRV